MPKSWFTIAFLLSFLMTTAVLQWFPPSSALGGLRWASQLPMYPREAWIVFALFGLLTLIIEACPYTGPPVPNGHVRAGLWVRKGFGFLLLCAVVGSALSFLRVSQTTHLSTAATVETYATGEEVTLHGFIADEPDRRPMSTKYTVAVDEIVLGDTSSSGRRVMLRVVGRVLATDYAAWPRHDYGDEVLVTGTLERPTKIEDFHYDRFLSRFGIYSVMYSAKVETLSTGHGDRFFTFLYGLKGRFEAQINRLYPEPHASFLSGLLTGSRRGIPKHLLEDFRATGLTHIIAISGYNITIVLSVVAGFLFFLPLRWRFLPALAAIAFFTFFVGADPSVVRAAIMGALGLFAIQAGRQKHSLIAILFAAFLMVAWNPKVLWYDVGFQLSFLSVLGLTYLAPFLQRLSYVVPNVLGLREAFQMTVAAQLAAIPLVVVIFGHFSLVAPITNMLIAILVPIGMLFGFLGTLISFFSFPLGQFIGFVSFGALELIIRIARFFADLPYVLLEASQVSHWWVWGYYVILVSGVWLLSARRRVASY